MSKPGKILTDKRPGKILLEPQDQFGEDGLFTETIFTIIHESLLILNTDFTIQAANPAFYKKFQLTDDETIGRNLFHLNSGEWDAPPLKSQLQEMQAGNVPEIESEIAFTFSAIGARIICVNAQTIKRKNGEQLILLALDDITLSKMWQTDLNANAAMLRNEFQIMQDFFMQAPAGFCIFRGPEHIFEFANPLFMSMAGETNLKGKSFKEAFLSPQAMQYLSMLDKVYTTGESFIGKEVMTTIMREGAGVENAYLDISCQPMRDAAGKIEGVLAFTYNVSQQVVSRKLLEAQAELVQDLLMKAPAWICTFIGPHHVFDLVNPRYQQLFGARQLVGKPLLEALPELAGQGIDTNMDKVYNTGEFYVGYEIPMHAVYTSGHPAYTKYFNFSLQAMYDENKTIYSILAIGYEVTEEVLARRSREKNEQDLVIILETMPHIAYKAMANGNLIYFNQRFYDYTGLSLKETKGKSFEDIVHPDMAGEVHDKWMNSVHTGDEYDQPLLLRSADASYRWHLSRASAIRDDNGHISMWVGTLTDIHDQKNFAEQLEGMVAERTRELKNATEQLQIQNEVYKNAEVNARIGSYVWNMDTGELKCSDNFYRVLGYEPQEFTLTLKKFLEFVHPDDLEHVKGRGRQTLESREVAVGDYRIVTKDGTIKNIRSSGKLIGDENQGMIVGTLQDVTQDVALTVSLQQANENLEESNIELERSNADLASFSFIASHDLQEPLRKIQTFSRIINESYRQQLPENAKDYFDRTIHAAQRMRKLIDSLLSFSRISTTKSIFELTDLNKTIEEVKETFKETIAERKAVIESQHLPTLNAVSMQMQQLFENLVGNAIKYSKPGHPPHIKITAHKTNTNEIGGYGREHASFWNISISDYGIGFDQQHEHKIFELFQRLHTHSDFEGTGIGLAICKKIVETHKGTIAATGIPGEGSTFTFFLDANLTNDKKLTK